MKPLYMLPNGRGSTVPYVRKPKPKAPVKKLLIAPGSKIEVLSWPKL